MCVIDSLQTETASNGALVSAELESDGATIVFERDDSRHVFKLELTKIGMTKIGAFE